MKRRMKQRVISIMMTIMMVIGLVPVDLLGGITQVKAKEDKSGTYTFDFAAYANELISSSGWADKDKFVAKGVSSVNATTDVSDGDVIPITIGSNVQARSGGNGAGNLKQMLDTNSLSFEVPEGYTADITVAIAGGSASRIPVIVAPDSTVNELDLAGGTITDQVAGKYVVSTKDGNTANVGSITIDLKVVEPDYSGVYSFDFATYANDKIANDGWADKDKFVAKGVSSVDAVDSNSNKIAISIGANVQARSGGNGAGNLKQMLDSNSMSFEIPEGYTADITATIVGGSASRIPVIVAPDGTVNELELAGGTITDQVAGKYVVSTKDSNTANLGAISITLKKAGASSKVMFTPTITGLPDGAQVRLVKGSTAIALTSGTVASVNKGEYSLKVYVSSAADAAVSEDYSATYNNATSITVDDTLSGADVAISVVSSKKNITVTIDADSKALLDAREAKLQYNVKGSETKTDIEFVDGSASIPVELDATYNITCTNSKLAVGEAAAEFTVAADTTTVAAVLTSNVMDVVIATEGESLGSATLKLTSVNNANEYVENLTNGSTAKDIWFNNDYKVEVVGDDSLEAKFAKNGASAYKILAADTTLTITLSKADVQPHIYDVWDFGAESLNSTAFVTYNNMLDADTINAQYSGVAGGTKGTTIPAAGFDFGEVKYNPAAKSNHRLRTTNSAVTRYDDKDRKDADGNVYTGYIYSNSASTADAYVAVTATKGDKFIFVVSSNGGAATYNWANPDGIVEATAKYSAANQAEVITFYAAVDGEYHLYVTDEKLCVARILREHATNVTVSGAITSTDGASLDGATLQFVQKSVDTDVTLSTFEAAISGGQYSVTLQEGFAYDLALAGKNGYIVESPLTTSYDRSAEGVAGTAAESLAVTVGPVDLSTFTGSLAELDATAAANLTLEFEVPEGKVFVPELTLDKKANTYTLKLEKGVTYGVKAVGVDDYSINKDTVADTDADGSVLNIGFTKKPVYNVTATVTGVDNTKKLKNLALTFARLADGTADLDGYTYEFTGVEGIQLRDGQYQVTAKLTGYTQGTTADLKVNGGDATVTIPMVSNSASESVAYSETIQVGADKPYTTINSALTAIKNMSDRNGRRVTIEIDPGDYEEMLYIDMPNISLKNASASPSIGVSNAGKDIDANAVRITGYYGHGYSYFSMNDKYQWDADTLAANKANGYESVTNPGSGTATMWNSTVVITGDNFTADGIIFENSFNIYVSRKAAEDTIVKLSSAKEGSEKRAEMEAGSIKVQEKAYVERAGALALGNNLEGAVFNNCRFVGRQDVLYGGKGTFAEFNQCTVAGAVDFIYGGMTAIFDGCTLVANTTNDKNDIAYIAAPQQDSGRGYLFWNCSIRKAIEGTEISAELGTETNQAMLGRPWTANTGEAVFYNTTINTGKVYTVDASGKRASDAASEQLVVANVGWLTSLGGESELCGEYNSVDANGNPVDVAERAAWSKQFVNKTITLEDGSEMEITPENWRKPVVTTVEWNDITYGSGANASRYWRTGSVEDGSVQIKVGEFGNGVEFKNNGKWVPASYDGLSYYYTTVPSYKNFTLRAKVHVNQFWLSNGQEAFGLMANDKLGGDGWNNSYAIGVTKTEYYWDEEEKEVTSDSSMKKVSQKFGVMAQEKKGITTFNYPAIKANDTETIQNDFSSALYPLEQRYPYSSNVIGNVLNNGSSENIVDMYMTIQKNNTGYFLTYESADGSYSVTKKYYDTATLNHLDPNKVYIGMFAARCADITFSEISFTITDPANDPPAEERPVETIATVATISSASTSNKAAYDLLFNGNADGTATLYVDDELVQSGYEVEAGTTLTIPVTLHGGNNRIKVVYDPADDYVPGEYQVMSEYGEIEVEQTVVFDQIDKNVIYTAPDAGGDGSKSNPMDLQRALRFAQPGTTIYMMDGTYQFKSTVTIPRGTNGTEESPIVLMADPENEAVPVIDGSKTSGIAMEVAGNYWTIAGIAVTNSANGKDGMHISGSHNLIEGVNTYNNGNTGLQISRLASTDNWDMWPSYNTILNCSSYNNADKGYEDADGFAAKLTIGDGNVFDGCIAYNNADDGWDLFAKVQTGSIGAVTIQNCVAYANGYLSDGTNAGNGNGFKMGGDSMSGHHVLINSVAFDNKAKGIDSNSCPDIEVYNCISFNNGSYNVALYTNAANTDFVAQDVISYRSGSPVDTAENIAMKNQDNTQVLRAGNYFWKSPIAGGVQDSSVVITDDWFERVDTYFDQDAHYYSESPVGRKADGTIDMKGLLVLKADRQEETGYLVDPGNGTISSNVVRLEKQAGTKLTSLSASLTDEIKEALGVSTVEELKNYMENLVAAFLLRAPEPEEGQAPDAHVEVIDLVPVMKDPVSGTFTLMTQEEFEQNFGESGMVVEIDLKDVHFEGDPSDYRFMVAHLIVNGWNGQQIGSVETFEVNAINGKLYVRVYSFSPFAIAWVRDEAEDDDYYVPTTDSGDKYSEIPVIYNVGSKMVVLTNQDKAKKAAGITNDDYLEIEIDPLDGNSASAKLIDALAAKNKLTVANYCDVNVYRVSSNGVRLERLTSLSSPLDLMFEVPDGLDGNKYDFGVIRVHDGVAELLKDTDNDPITISVASDKFSAYAVVYGEKGSIANVKAANSKLISKGGSKASPKTFDQSKYVPEVPETEIAQFAQKQVEKQLEQEVTDLLITPQASRFPIGIVIAALLALAAFVGGEVIYFRRKKQK